ncbi:amidohydrolase family protein [Yinghuangia aomiensis]
MASTFCPADEVRRPRSLKLDARGVPVASSAPPATAASRTVLDAVAHARAANGPRDARRQVVHVEMPRPRRRPRFRDLGVVACMQPRHCAPEICRPRPGPGRRTSAKAAGSRRGRCGPWTRRGAVLAFSSDWNVAEMDPMIGIYTAVTRRAARRRRSVDARRDGGRRRPPCTATMGSAYASFLEHERGSLTVGKVADFVVLSRDIFAVEAGGDPGHGVRTGGGRGEVVHEAR